jgi:hypothetical protein
MNYIDNEKLIEDVKMVMKIPELRTALYHKVEEYKISHKKRIEEYREIEKMVDPEKKEKPGDPVKEIRFEIRKKKAGWMVNPVDIPQEIVKHITTMDLTPGIIKMQKFKIDGKNIDLSFEMQARDCFTGSIKEKSIKTKKENPSIQARKADNKTGDLKTFITYLMNNKTLCDWMVNEFFEHWKPLIDDDFITSELSER